MLLSGTVNAMPVPGTSMRILRRRSRCTSCQVWAVTTASSTAFSVFSSPRVERVSCTAVPVPTVRRVTFTPWASYNCRKASAVRRSVMVLIRNSELTALALLTVQ